MVRICSALLSALLLFSCASAPSSTVPEWVLTTPKPDGSFTYFVGEASGPIADPAGVTDGAAANLIASIMQYIGVKVSVNTTATARATLDSYSADIKQSVTTQSNNRLAGFQIKEKVIREDKKAGIITVYVLAAYATQDLEKEKRRIAALFQEKEDAVSKPEAAGKALAEEGRHYEAVRRFVEAAIAASGADIENADIKVTRNLDNARAALGRIRFERAVTEYKAYLSQPFPEPFRARLVSGEGSAAPGIPGAVILATYQRRQGSRTTSKTESLSSGPNGTISFSPPPPDFVGKAKLVYRVDFQPVIDLLDALPPKWAAQRDSLQAELRTKSLEIEYQIISRAKDAPTALAIVDLSENGTPVQGAATQAGLAELLSKEGFKLVPVPIDAQLVSSGADEAIIAQAKVLLEAKAERLAYGVSRMVSVRKDGSMYLAQAQSTVKVIELASGRILYSGEKQSTGLGPDEAAARRAVYRDLGLNALGKDLISSLP